MLRSRGEPPDTENGVVRDTGTLAAEKPMVEEAAVVALRTGPRRNITAEGDSGVSCGLEDHDLDRPSERKK